MKEKKEKKKKKTSCRVTSECAKEEVGLQSPCARLGEARLGRAGCQAGGPLSSGFLADNVSDGGPSGVTQWLWRRAAQPPARVPDTDPGHYCRGVAAQRRHSAL